MEKGKLLVISGFSGAGKGTIVNKIMKENDDFSLSISATTRSMRKGEVDGVNYFFVTKEEFEKMIRENLLLEHAQYQNNYYGTPKKFVIDKLESGKNVILEIEMLGAFQIKKIFEDAVLIFISTLNAKQLYNRLKSRNTESEEQIEGRMQRSILEAENMSKYDYVVVNDDLETAVSDIKKIAKGEYKNSIDINELSNKIVKEIKEKKYV